MKKAETQNNNLLKGWRKVKLEELVIPGGSVSGPFGSDIKSIYFRPKGVPIIRGNNLTMNIDKGRYIDDDYIFLDPKKFEELKKAEALPEDIIITARGTIGQTGIIPRNSKYPRYIISANQLRFRIDKQKADPLFVYYQLSLKYMAQQMQNYSVNVGVPNFNLTAARNLELLIPEDISEQKRIADILSAFDDKIELNNKIIKTLEEMVQEIFKEWFVRFRFPGWEKVKFVNSELGKIPEGWEVRKFEEIMEFLSGKNPDSTIFNSSGKYYIYGSNTIMGKSDNLLYNGPIVILARIGSNCGALRLSITPCWISNNTAGIKGKNDISTFFIYLLLKNFDFTQIKEGTGQPYINIKALKSYITALPSRNILKNFEEVISSFYFKIQQKVEENQKLTELRDLLLPKLMSGEIRV